LKFPDEETARTHIYTIEYVGAADPDTDEQIGREELTQRYVNSDIIGIIHDSYIPLPGWHVNIRALPDEDVSNLEQFCVHPTNPRRVWA
jgi:hypothetical protein